MHQIDDAVVSGGRLILTDLPLPEGQRVRIVIAEVGSQCAEAASIHEIRQILKGGGVERFEEPLEPMIPPERWGMLK